jgi:hypothetical protein
MTGTAVTNHSLWCHVYDHWVYFDHAAITGYDLTHHTLILTFTSTVPLKIAGNWAPWIAVAIAHFRYGTNVADWKSFDNLNQGTLAQFLIDGGTLTMDIGDDFIMKAGSVIDVSGGKVTYTGGDKTTTYVHGAGKWTEISKADPNVFYDKVMDLTQHNVSGYVVGKNAGSVQINVPTAPALAAGCAVVL